MSRKFLEAVADDVAGLLRAEGLVIDRESYDRLAAHLGHDDPERITKADIVGRKDALLGAGKAGKTVKNHVDVVHALYNAALENERLKRRDNPAKGVNRDLPDGLGGSVQRL